MLVRVADAAGIPVPTHLSMYRGRFYQWEIVMNRRKFLYAASAGTASATFAAPAISQGMRELKMVTSWPKGLPGLQASAERVAQGITMVTGKRLQVKVFGAGEMVKPFEVFDAVSSGVAEMYHTAEYYWEKQVACFQFLYNGAIRIYR